MLTCFQVKSDGKFLNLNESQVQSPAGEINVCYQKQKHGCTDTSVSRQTHSVIQQTNNEKKPAGRTNTDTGRETALRSLSTFPESTFLCLNIILLYLLMLSTRISTAKLILLTFSQTDLGQSIMSFNDEIII